MKAFRADLQQKSFNARKTNNYEDRLNVTYKGMVNQNSEEHYKAVSENLEKSVNFLTGVLHAAEYRAGNAVMQNALKGRSNNINEGDGYIATPTVNPLPDSFKHQTPPGYPGTQQHGPMAPFRPGNPLGENHPMPGQTYTDPQGYTYTYNDGRWTLTGRPPQIKPAPRPTTQPVGRPSKPVTPRPGTGETTDPNYRPVPKRPGQGEPTDPGYIPLRR